MFLVNDKKSLFLSLPLKSPLHPRHGHLCERMNLMIWVKKQSEGSGEFHLKLEDWGLVAGKVELLHVGAGAICCEFVYILYA